MITLDEIKSMLIDVGYADCSELDRYCSLISSHFNHERVKYVTEKHHIVPQYHKRECNRCVNLRHADHALAHLYLALAAVRDEDKRNNFAAVSYIIHSDKFPVDQIEFIQQLDKYQQARTNYIILNSELQKGKRAGNLNAFYGKHHTEESRAKMREHSPHLSGKNHPNYGNHLSEEAKQRIGQANSVNRNTPDVVAKRFKTMEENNSWAYLDDPNYHEKMRTACTEAWNSSVRREAAAKSTTDKWKDLEYREKHRQGMIGKKHKVTKRACSKCKKLISLSNLPRHEKVCKG